MRYLSVFVALVVTVTGCAGRTGSPSVSTPMGSQRPAWQHHMDRARRFAAAGKTFELLTSSRLFVFYNSPRPFCYMYTIPGN